ncbi:MAG: zinc ribbon domain-containing protein [Desulfobacterales bacterium]|nr:zinc ribbon domain-containing protein [Desulfobacterales bacterium]
MAFDNCPACNQQVSVGVLTCPNCGHPLTKEKKPLASRLLRVLIQLTAAAMLFVGAMKFAAGSLEDALIWGVVGIVLLHIGVRTKEK